MSARPHPQSFYSHGSRVVLKGVRGVRGTVNGFDGYYLLIKWDGYSFTRRHTLDEVQPV